VSGGDIPRGQAELTILLTSARVAPGLLSWQAWAALRAASRVLVSSGHPQAAALAEAGVAVEVVAATACATDPAEYAGLARFLADAVRAGPGGPVAWLAPAGTDATPELLGALASVEVSGAGVNGARVNTAELEVQVLHGSRDLPGAHLLDVVGVMDTLRTSCPWDRKQTHASLAPHLLEEPYEALEALENGDDHALREELGDVLLQVVFHARIAAERSGEDGGYDIDDIADTLVAKLVRRHPHVFAGVSVSSAEDVNRNWDEIKKAERAARDRSSGPPSVLDGVVFGQPALSLAAQLLRRAARAGFPAGDGLARGDGLGDQLLRLAARAREAGLDPETELRAAARRLAVRVRDWELRQA
jgi:XTP/dITP diphosphohydrolase